MTHDDWVEYNPNDCFLTCNICYDTCVLVHVIAEWKKGHEDEP